MRILLIKHLVSLIGWRCIETHSSVLFVKRNGKDNSGWWNFGNDKLQAFVNAAVRIKEIEDA